ncbi:Adaptin [Hexamita inflata]|uniref:Adaptin n=1 Tax=Hexamita inflata TaxID=28002 RepID=A0ABP1I0S7_9EUKA
MISSCFVLNPRGETLALRQYRNDLPKEYLEVFINRAVFQEEMEGTFVPPIFEADGLVYAHIQHYSLHYGCVTSQDANMFILIEYLNQLAKVFDSYFEKATEDNLMENVNLVYELLDETMDYGYPQTLEPDVLKAFIQSGQVATLMDLIMKKKQQRVQQAPPAVTGMVSWRKEGVKYRVNEVYLDVVEQVDAISTLEGRILSQQIKGAFKMRSQLSGQPNLKLGLNDRVRFEQAFGQHLQAQQPEFSLENKPKEEQLIELEDIKLHQCVRLTQFETDKTISFIPPDGSFDLLSYRINQPHKKPVISVNIQEVNNKNGLQFNLVLNTNYKESTIAKEITVYVPVPIDADTPVFKCQQGDAKYKPQMQAMEWVLKSVPGKASIKLTASFGLPLCRVLTEEITAYTKKPITVKFEIPYFSLSGVCVKYLKIHDKSGYEATPWVRYLASGVITIRR